jgi:MFS family permease
MEKTLTPEESLRIIQKSISTSRKNIREGSFYYLLWGWALILAALANYFLIRHLIQMERYDDIVLLSLLAWGVFIIAAMIIQFVYQSRARKREKVVTHLDRYIKIIWITAGLLMVLMIFLSLKLQAYPTAFILGVTAMATAVSGLMIRFRPLVIGAVIFLAAAVIASYLKGTDQLLVFAVAMALGYLVPGYIIRTSKNGGDV